MVVAFRVKWKKSRNYLATSVDVGDDVKGGLIYVSSYVVRDVPIWLDGFHDFNLQDANHESEQGALKSKGHSVKTTNFQW